MFAIGLAIGIITGTGLTAFTAVMAYRLAQLHATEED